MAKDAGRKGGKGGQRSLPHKLNDSRKPKHSLDSARPNKTSGAKRDASTVSVVWTHVAALLSMAATGG